MDNPKDKLSLWFRGVASTPEWFIESEQVGEVCQFTPTSTRTSEIIGEYAKLFVHSPELKDCLQSIAARLKNTSDMPQAQMPRLYWYAAQLAGIRDLAMGVDSASVQRLVQTRDSEGEPIDRPALSDVDLAIICKPNPLNRPASGPIELAYVGPTNEQVLAISNRELGVICEFAPTTPENTAAQMAYARCFAVALKYRGSLQTIAADAQNTADMPESPLSRMDWYARRLNELAATARYALALEQALPELPDDMDGAGENPDAYQAQIMQRGN